MIHDTLITITIGLTEASEHLARGLNSLRAYGNNALTTMSPFESEFNYCLQPNLTGDNIVVGNEQTDISRRCDLFKTGYC